MTTQEQAQSFDGNGVSTVRAQTFNWRQRRRFSTGVAALDLITGGLGQGEISYFLARSGGGKTALAITMAKHIAMSGKYRRWDGSAPRVLLAVKEADGEDALERLAAAELGIEWERIRYENHPQNDWGGDIPKIEPLSAEEWELLTNGIKALEDAINSTGLRIWTSPTRDTKTGRTKGKPLNGPALLKELGRVERDDEGNVHPFYDVAIGDYLTAILGTDPRVTDPWMESAEETVKFSRTAVALFEQLNTEAMKDGMDKPAVLTQAAGRGAKSPLLKSFNSVLIDFGYRTVQQGKKTVWERIESCVSFTEMKLRVRGTKTRRILTPFWFGAYGQDAVDNRRKSIIDRFRRQYPDKTPSSHNERKWAEFAAKDIEPWLAKMKEASK